MNKKERFQAVCEKRVPDCMPVFPRVKAQTIWGQGLKISEVTGPDWFDSDKITEAVLASIKNVGYDVAIGSYIDIAFGIPALGGKISIPTKFGMAVGTPDQEKPVQTKADWPKIKKKLATCDVTTADPRMKGALEVIKNVSREVGDEMALVPMYAVGTSAAMVLLRPTKNLIEDMVEDPEWVEEMCHDATDFAIDWIRAQYEAGANSSAFISEAIGTALISPEMSERFNLENIARVVETVRKEFNQGTWIHIHGDMKTPKAYKYLIKLAMQAGIQGFHFDEKHPTEWIMQNVVYRLGKPACIITHGDNILNGPVEKIRREVKEQISQIGDGLGVMMAPSCQILNTTSNENFKAWVDASHEYGKYPLQ
ncbi:MAG: hypothetical protein JSU83_22485 [Deltaproteobacteria bacterium]|nr:MAG: hypothetical protein JSU83_22485 [Deltaproteobacteria bacterium]